MLLVVFLALFCAFLFSASAILQQAGTRAAAAGGHTAATHHPALAALLPVARLMRSLAHSRLWLLGWVANTVGFFVQAVALQLGSVALVQPLLVTQLLFTLSIVSVRARQRPAARDWAAAVSVCGGVAVFLSVRGAAPQAGASNRPHLIAATLITAAAVGGLVVAGYGRAPAVHTVCFATAAGLCFAVSAAMTKLTTADLLHRGIPATAADWPGYTLAAFTALSLILEQEAFGVGPLPIAIAAMSVVNPVASYVLGVTAFDVHLATGPLALGAVATAGLLLALGAVGLAHSGFVAHDASPELLAAKK